MEVVQFVLPTIATLALGTALLVPQRDDRRGKRATLGGPLPLRPDFRVVRPLDDLGTDADARPARSEKPEREDTVRSSTAADDSQPTSMSSEMERPFSSSLASRPHENDTLGDSFVEAALDVTAANEPIHAFRRLTRAVRFWQHFRHALGGIPRSATSARDEGATATMNAADATDLAAPAGRDDAVTIERSFATEVGRLLTQREPYASDDARTAATQPSPPAEPANREPIAAAVNARIRNGQDRVVPLTRLPLRPQGQAVTWPAELDPARIDCSCEERHAILARLTRVAAGASASVLETAYVQEDGNGRSLALRALARTDATRRTRATFVYALRTGTDDERTIALDALATHGEREDLIPGLNDRVEAIAAQAALTYVASHRRGDYREQLLPHIDAARVESILVLLAGVVE